MGETLAHAIADVNGEVLQLRTGLVVFLGVRHPNTVAITGALGDISGALLTAVEAAAGGDEAAASTLVATQVPAVRATADLIAVRRTLATERLTTALAHIADVLGLLGGNELVPPA